ncbi:hypothetical protein [Sutcliffiella deserti]|uniref:hypothetical protein n=1 Tax=Sutcliffiella deserti TaxID=2875501 RepID=UPI001CBD81A0|nr:hypothetical protein [Sutcliffiella deserti]
MSRVHILNTNQSSNKACEVDMLNKEKCAAYYGKWKQLIHHFKKDDLVFLYSNKKGIIARGIATGIVETANHEGHEKEEFFMKLKEFQRLKIYLAASEIRDISGMNIMFGQTLFTFKHDETGRKVWEYITKYNV